jgi:alpha-L-rhamnosidase
MGEAEVAVKVRTHARFAFLTAAGLYQRIVIPLPKSCLLLVVSGVLAAANMSAESVEPVRSHLATPAALRCMGKTEPLAIVEPRPELSWRVKAAAPSLHGIRQSHYEIRIANRDSDLRRHSQILWDSGDVASSATSASMDAVSTPSFEAGHDYSWQVRVWDEEGRLSPWSKPAHWRGAPEWKANWIGAEATDDSRGEEGMPLLRKEVSLSSAIRRAVLHVSGLGQYEFRINGTKVGNSRLVPGWSDYRKTVYYDSYDVTSTLRTGDNVLGILLGNGMYRVLDTPGRYEKFTGSFGALKCIVQLEVEYTNGKKVTLQSDGTWKTHAGPITFSNTYGGEDYDARRDSAGWDKAGFDDGDWRPVVKTDGPGGSLRPEAAPPIRVMLRYSAIHRSEPRPGVLVYDLGQNFAGWPVIEVSGPAGKTVKLIPGELLDEKGVVSQVSSGEPQWYSYTLKGGGGIERWRPRFSYYGFRYVQVEGATADKRAGPDVPRLVSLRGEAIHTSSEPVGNFSSSDVALNRIHRLIVRAIENNAESLFTDCPHREKLGWLEETHLMAPAMLYDFDFKGLYAATARNIADTQTQDGPSEGRIPAIAPQYVLFDPKWGIFDDSPEWGSAAVLAPWYVYQRDGDLTSLLSNLDVMRRYVDYLGTRAQGNIIAYGLGDWYDIGPGEPGVSKLTSAGVTATATYYQDLRVVEKALALAGRNDESRIYGRKADEVQQSFNARFFDSANHRYDRGSQAAQAMPLVVGLVPRSERARVLATLVADIQAHNNHVTAGDIGYHYVVDALLEGNRSDVLYEMLERTDSPSYGFQLAQGATALTESWDANPRSSQDHFMLGHAEEWFYRGLSGIEVDFALEPPSQLVLRPHSVGTLQWVRTSYESVWGRVESKWQRGSAQIEYDFLIPANATASLVIETASPQSLRVGGRDAAHAAGVVKATLGPDTIELVVGSGRYQITADSEAKKP